MSDVIGPPVSRHKHPSVLMEFPAFANNFCYCCSRVLEFVTGKPCFTIRVIFVTPKRAAASLPWTYVQSQWLPNLSYDGAQCLLTGCIEGLEEEVLMSTTLLEPVGIWAYTTSQKPFGGWEFFFSPHFVWFLSLGFLIWRAFPIS